jgi:hypothetical protein
VDPGGQPVGVLPRGAAHDQVAPLADGTVALALQLVGELARGAARAAVHAHLPGRVAVLELLLLPRLRGGLVVPALLVLEPVLDPRVAADELRGALCLRVRVRVDEDVVPVARDREAAAVDVARLLEAAQQRACIVGRDVDPEVVYAGILPDTPICSRCFVIPPRKNG